MKSRFLIFIGVLVLLFLYTGFKIHQILPGRKWLSAAITGVLILMIVGTHLFYRSRGELAEDSIFRILTWSGAITMGIWAAYLLLSMPFDLALAFDPARRTLFQRWLSFGTLGASLGIAGVGLWQANCGLHIKEVLVPIKDLPEALTDFKIAQISDLHVGSTIQQNYVQKVVEMVQSTQPDLIAVTGDLCDGHPQTLKIHTQPLSQLSAPLGVYYCMGNHEYYWNAHNWLAEAKTWGFIPLVDENRVVEHKGHKVLVAGVADTSASGFIPEHTSDPHKAVQTSEAVAFKLLLAHRPDSSEEAEKAGFDLQLSGHTHAGQFFPFRILVALVHKFYQGLNRSGNLWVYVNSGTGYWGPPNRFTVPPEVTLLKLIKA